MTTKARTYQFIQFISLITAGISALTIAGYISGNPFMYAWAGLYPMALNTSICLLLQSASTFLIARRLFYTVSNKP